MGHGLFERAVVTPPQIDVTPPHNPNHSPLMSTSGGLSRRRVGAGNGNGGNGTTSSYNDYDDDNNKPNYSTTNGGAITSRSNSPPLSSQHNAHAGSAFEGGNKIAFDPRDLQQDASEEARTGGKMPRLTILEEVLLLGIKDKQVKLFSFFPLKVFLLTYPKPDLSSLPLIQGYLSFWNDNISYALRGCILIELALRRRIALVRDANRRRIPIAERILEVIDDRQTGETILDEALKMMKMQQEVEKMSINAWIDLLSGEFFFSFLKSSHSPVF